MLTSITDGVLRSELICHSQVRNSTSWQPPAGSAGDICKGRGRAGDVVERKVSLQSQSKIVLGRLLTLGRGESAWQKPHVGEPLVSTCQPTNQPTNQPGTGSSDTHLHEAAF